MKSSKLTAAFIIFGTMSFVSCKKGENDPALSLKSRTSRLVGTWNLVSGQETKVDYDFGNQETFTSTTVYNESSYTETTAFQDVSGTTTSAPQTISYTLEYSFEKDGAFSLTQIEDGNSDIDKGFWYWGGKSKTQDLKKKETVVIAITETNDGQIDTYGGTAVSADGSFQLDRLTGKELSLIVDIQNTYNNGDTYTKSSTLNFEKK
jgi:hypothetical protein